MINFSVYLNEKMPTLRSPSKQLHQSKVPKRVSSAVSFKPGFDRKFNKRPTSAREIFEYTNQKKNEEAWKFEQMQSDVKTIKNREFQTKFYNNLTQYSL